MSAASHSSEEPLPPRPSSDNVYDAIVIGSGFGGSMVAHELVGNGRSVLMLEQGDWVERGPHNWEPLGTGEFTAHFTRESGWRVLAGGYKDWLGTYACVGGQSVFYGTVSMRMRSRDFEADPLIVGESGAAWPYGYDDLEPYYARAEQILSVAGRAGDDPTEAPRSNRFPQGPAKLAPISQRLHDSATELGLHPFRLPLAINHRDDGAREACIECFTCDTYPCAISAKNDLPTVVLEPLTKKGLEIATKMAAIRLHAEGSRIIGVECFDKTRQESVTYRAKTYVLCGGALASPHLLLASGLEALNPAGELVGRFLMRHCNAVAFGVFPKVLPSNQRFHKQIGIHDYYFGHPKIRAPAGKLGCIQQIHVPPIPLIKHYLPAALRFVATPLLSRASGLIVIAEDQPQAANRIDVEPTKNGLGMPRPTLTHHYTQRDLAARRALLRAAKKLFRGAGAVFSGVHRVRTFSHAVGTLRAGPVPEQAPLDGFGAFRGVDNLFVADGSFMPRSAGVNPSLTIAANALRVGERLCTL